jgi:ankyrin repeat protein
MENITELITSLFKNNPKINYQDKNYNNVLHKLVLTGNKKIIKNYLNILKKENIYKLINEKNKEGYTPLHLAVKNNYQKITDLLIRSGADTDIPDPEGRKVKYFPDNIQTGGNIRKKITIKGFRYL